MSLIKELRQFFVRRSPELKVAAYHMSHDSSAEERRAVKVAEQRRAMGDKYLLSKPINQKELHIPEFLKKAQR